jgi:hypothetical protein
MGNVDVTIVIHKSSQLYKLVIFPSLWILFNMSLNDFSDRLWAHIYSLLKQAKSLSNVRTI